MKIEFEKDDILDIIVKPNSSLSQIRIIDGNLNVFVKSPPIDNKANDEIVKIFKKEMKVSVKIIKGLNSKKKRIIVL